MELLLISRAVVSWTDLKAPLQDRVTRLVPAHMICMVISNDRFLSFCLLCALHYQKVSVGAGLYYVPQRIGGVYVESLKILTQTPLRILRSKLIYAPLIYVCDFIRSLS